MIRAFMVNQRQSAALAEAHGDDARGFADDRSVRLADKGVCDTASVDVGSWHSLRYWSQCLGVSETQLVRATRAVGSSIVRIETYFAEKRASRARKRDSVEPLEV